MVAHGIWDAVEEFESHVFYHLRRTASYYLNSIHSTSRAVAIS